jgi:hypothetical protein
MKDAGLVLPLLAAALAGCGTPGVAEDLKWAVECPKTVDRGAQFFFILKAANAAGEPVDDVRYRYQILWTGGASNPLRHKGSTGERQMLHARMVAGPATIVFTFPNREGLDTKVLETTFEVK